MFFQLVGGAHQIGVKIHEYVSPLEHAKVSAESLRMMRAETVAVRDALDRVDVTRLNRFKFVQAVLVSNAVLPGLLEEIEFALKNAYLDGSCEGHRVAASAFEVAETLKPFEALLLQVITERGGAARSDTFPI